MTTGPGRQQAQEDTTATLEDPMQSAGWESCSGENKEVEEEDMNLSGRLLSGDGLRLSNTPESCRN